MNRDMFLGNRPKLKSELVAVPEYGPEATIMVEELTALQKGIIQSKSLTWKDGETSLNLDAMAESDIALVIASARCEPGVPMFEETDKGVLAGFGGELIGRIAEAARRVSGMDKTNKQAKEEAKGN